MRVMSGTGDVLDKHRPGLKKRPAERVTWTWGSFCDHGTLAEAACRPSLHRRKAPVECIGARCCHQQDRFDPCCNLLNSQMLLLHLPMQTGSEAFNYIVRAVARDGLHTSHCTTFCGHRSHGNLESSDVCCEALGIEVRTQTDLGPLVSTFENRRITPPSHGHCKNKTSQNLW